MDMANSKKAVKIWILDRSEIYGGVIYSINNRFTIRWIRAFRAFRIKAFNYVDHLRKQQLTVKAAQLP